MSEEVMVQLLSDIQEENIRFGDCFVKFTFRDGRVQNYSITTTKNRLINSGTRIKRCNSGFKK